MKHLYLCMDFFFVFTVAFAVIDRIEHEQGSDHESWDNSGKKQITDRCTRCHAVHDEWNTRRNDNTESTSHCNDCSRKCQIITKIGQDWNRHTSNSSNRCRSRTGDRTVKKAGDDYGTWHTSSEFAKKIGKNIKQLFGNTALGHDDTGKDKHWNCQEREGVQTAKHGTNQIFGTNSKGRIKHRRKNRCDSKGDGYRNCDDQ